jgi:hypothetical protein
MTCTPLPDVPLSNGKIAAVSVHDSGTVMLTVYAHPSDMSFNLHVSAAEAMRLAGRLLEGAQMVERADANADPERAEISGAGWTE